MTLMDAGGDGDWAAQELDGLVLNDQRLEARAVQTLQTLFRQTTESIPTACQTAAEVKATYRFFNNSHVSMRQLLAPHHRQTRQRVRCEPVVLAISDISELDYTGKQVAQDLGLIGDNYTRGLFLVPLLAITPERVPLGLVDLYYWLRQPSTQTAQQRKRAPLIEKETYCWLREYRQACRLAADAPDTQVVYLTDRGGDLFEVYHEHHQRAALPHADFVIRAVAHDRCLCEADEAGQAQCAHLFAELDQRPVLAELSYTLKARASQPSRVVKQSVRAATVLVAAPERRDHSVADTPFNVVLLTEIAPPAGSEPVEWLLFTSLPVSTPEEVQRVVEYYLCRWEIELFFKILKSGCQVERLYLQTRERLFNCLALYLIITWRVLYCTHLGRACPEIPCTAVFTDAEWKALYLIQEGDTLPPRPITLREMVALVGRCGGFVGRKGDGDPGITSMFVGLRRLYDYALAYQRFGPEVRQGVT
jgi:hypothetical protein